MSESEKAAWAKKRTQVWRDAWIELIKNMSADSLQILYEDREDIVTYLIDNSEFEDFTDELHKKRRKEVDSSSFSILWQKLTEEERDYLLEAVHDDQIEEGHSYYTEPGLRREVVDNIVATFEELSENERLLGGDDNDDTVEDD
jgi:hypothetical protein